MKSLTYIAKYCAQSEPGVNQKINDIRITLNEHNFDFDLCGINPKNKPLKIAIQTISHLIRCNSKYIILRSIGVLDILLIPAIFFLRLKNKYVVIDLPVPRCVAYYEVIGHRKGLAKIRYLMLYYVCGPWSYWPYSKIVQYADESLFFRFGNKKRTILMGNGISSKRIGRRIRDYRWPSDSLNLIAVANISNYHGYDRVIKALHFWNNSSTKNFKIYCSFVGEGPETSKIRDITNDLGVKEYISFLGYRNTSQLSKLYSNHHLAISSLGLFRINVFTSSVLKSREYCLAGIPFLACGHDPDFIDNPTFRFLVKNEDEIESIIKQLESFSERLPLFTNDDIRNYALEHLTLESKLKIMGICLD